LGVDLGTSGCKVMIFDVHGKPQAYAYREYPTYTPAPKSVEQDADEWWRTTCANVREVVKKSGVKAKDIIGIGTTAQSTSMICVDSEGNALRRAFVYLDNRAQPQIKRLTELLGQVSWTASKIHANILWMRDNEPSIEKNIHAVMDAKEFIGFKLTKNVTFDEGLQDEAFKEIDKLNTLLGVPNEWFGESHGYFRPIGNVTSNAAKQTLLAKGTPVVVGPWDGMCNILGSGLTEGGIAMDTAGATEIMSVAISKPIPILCLPHFIPGLWLTYSSPPRGLVHRWFRDTFALGEKNTAKKLNVDVYDLLNQEAESVEPGSEKLLFIPTLHEFDDPSARGVFLGIALNHSRKHFIRAVLEGIAFSIREHFEMLESLGAEIREVRMSGGGAKSRIWNQIRSDVTGKTFAVLNVPETGCLGAALLAGIGTGIYHDVKEASEVMIKVSERVEPREENHRRYTKLFRVYKEANSALKNVFAELAGI